jgi:GT2 family glycosyltransferase/glycosyltransferase involved in cell wall biosynthesis
MAESLKILPLVRAPRTGAGLDELRKCLAAKEQTLAALRAERTAGQRLEGVLCRQSSELREQVASRQRELQELQNRFATTRDAQALLQVQLASALGELTALQGQFTDVQSQLGAIQASASWKLAQALRRVKTALAPSGGIGDKFIWLNRRAWRVWRRDGFAGLVRKIGSKLFRRITGSVLGKGALVTAPANVALLASLPPVIATDMPRPGDPVPAGTSVSAGAAAPPAESRSDKMTAPTKPASSSPSWTQLELSIALPILAEILQHAPRNTSGTTPVDVVVPIYAGLNEALRCLRSVLASASETPYELVVVDDGGTDLALSSCLRIIAERGLITLHRNQVNLGFVRSANIGLSRKPDRDVVLLNSDTEVHNHWLDRLRRAAYSAPDVGTVTPFSNNATICSYPRFPEDNPLPADVDAAALDAMCARVNDGRVVELPTGVGFCFYVRRACLQEVGLFDAGAFGRGYGEENDFCMRARHRGWRSVLAADVFVYHQGGVSFGAEKSPAIARALAALNERNPDYLARIDFHIAADPALPLRRQIDLARIAGPSRAVLFVLHDLGGGTERHVIDMARRLEEESTRALVLRPAGGAKVRLDCPSVPGTPNLVFDVQEEYWTLGQALLDLAVQHVHFHHLINVPKEVQTLISDLELPYDCTLHDYYTICPRINLINGAGAYCGEPSEQGCQVCLEKNGSYGGQKPDIGAWRRIHGTWLAGARKVIVPHTDMGRRLARYFPEINFTERRHFERLAYARRVRAPFVPGETLRVALIGVLAPSKGLAVVTACARDALARNLPVRFHVIGAPEDPEILALPNVSCTGAYKEEEVFDLLARERCHCAFFASLWPETYCYTLSIAFMGQLPPIAFDLGAQAARIRETGFGHVLPLTTDPRAINDALLRLSSEFTECPEELKFLSGQYPNLLADYYGTCKDPAADAA